MIGQSLGQYEIEELLGKGGMGEVYAARDTRLGRRVALKVLPPELSEDGAERRRFEREARAIAALDHPHIVTIFSVETAPDGRLFMTMQLVEGPTLGDLLASEDLELPRILDLFADLADGLASAHDRGVIHRDLKPGNVMIAADGTPKILDFGLAKMTPAMADPDGATATLAMTQAGLVMGTVPYMSPEQAAGKPADARSDVFALGIMLYEAVTGRHPFTGDTPVTILSSILKDTPEPLTRRSGRAPRELERLVDRALAKEPDERIQTARDLRNELRALRRRAAEPPSPMGRLRARLGAYPTRWSWRAAGGALGALTLTVVVAVGGGALWPGEEDAASIPLVPTAFAQITSRVGVEMYPSISPDGEWVAYEVSGPEGVFAYGNKDIHVLGVGGSNPNNLTADWPDTDDRQPAFSPDGRQIAFASNRDGGGIYVMGRTGESPRRLTESGHHPTWSPDGSEIAYSTETVWVPIDPNAYSISELWAVGLEDGAQRRILAGNPVQPEWSPDGRWIAYWGFGAGGRADVWLVPAAGGEPVAVTADEHTNWNPAWAPDGRHLYFVSTRSGPHALWRVEIDPATGASLGAPVLVPTPSPAALHVSVSADGSAIAYASVTNAANVQWWPFDPAAAAATGPPTDVTTGTNLFYNPEASPDGEWVAFLSLMPQQDIFVARVDGSEVRNLTDDSHLDGLPRWSPDGQRIAFHSNRGGRYEIWSIHRDGTGLTPLTRTSDADHFRPFWSPDGTRLAYTDSRFETLVAPLQNDGSLGPTTALPALQEPGMRFEGYAWSPDGSRIAGHRYPSRDQEEATRGILVYELADGSYREITARGYSPAWMPDSRRLVYQSTGALFMVDVDSGTSREILRAPAGAISYRFSLSRDGTRLFTAIDDLKGDIWRLTLE